MFLVRSIKVIISIVICLWIYCITSMILISCQNKKSLKFSKEIVPNVLERYIVVDFLSFWKEKKSLGSDFANCKYAQKICHLIRSAT